MDPQLPWEYRPEVALDATNASIDPNYPDWLKERLKGSMKRYGHSGSFAIMIEVDKVLDAREAP
jgi:hypothetical protein